MPQRKKSNAQNNRPLLLLFRCALGGKALGFSSSRSSRYALGARWPLPGAAAKLTELVLKSRLAAKEGDSGGVDSLIVLREVFPYPPRESGRKFVKLIDWL